MASTVFSQSLFSAQSSSPSPISKKTIGNVSVFVKTPLSISRSHVVSTNLRKTHKSFVANSAKDSSSAETPIELQYPAFPSVMDINQIRDILPHRFPFLLVDRVIEYTPGVSAVGIKNVTINDNFFPGHFPERPIMPGVLMVEVFKTFVDWVLSLGRPDLLSSLVIVRQWPRLAAWLCYNQKSEATFENFFFAGVDKVRFRKLVIAGDTLVMRMNLVKLQKRFGIAKMEGKAYVGGEVVCEGEFLMAMGSG
ncbi:hypothetical protein DH2020_024047 [Rehmannia glutinosa]|uniref:3-hydroxyacyl-[acyl-carrier-protein] dehydratase n=1 Tax=Rehmannia glutinosa TaxID=99300 RepID=A0ABR0WBL1_REHGL